MNSIAFRKEEERTPWNVILNMYCSVSLKLRVLLCHVWSYSWLFCGCRAQIAQVLPWFHLFEGIKSIIAPPENTLQPNWSSQVTFWGAPATGWTKTRASVKSRREQIVGRLSIVDKEGKRCPILSGWCIYWRYISQTLTSAKKEGSCWVTRVLRRISHDWIICSSGQGHLW